MSTDPSSPRASEATRPFSPGTATEPAGPAASPGHPGPFAGHWSYGRLWKRTPGSAVYLLLAFALSMISLPVLFTLLWTGVGLLVIVVGIVLIVASLVVARGFGAADLFLLQLTGQEPIRHPAWNRDRTDRRGFWRALTLPVRNPHSWTALLHGTLVAPVLGLIGFVCTVTWVSAAFGGLTYGIWATFLPGEARPPGWGERITEALPWVFAGWDGRWIEIVLSFGVGVLFVLTLPWVVNGIAWLHHGAARGLLGRWASDDLAAELRAETRARSAAMHAEGVSLRRLERDIHDGPQQRLVRLQLDLAALERRVVAGDETASVQLAREARTQVTAALHELRALSSGVAPPLLQDRGLSAALDALARGSAVPARTEIAPGIDAAVPEEVARNAYFVAAELLTNAAKHAGAAQATLSATTGTGAVAGVPELQLAVTDDGVGGADFVAGGGLEGLRERISGLRGSLRVNSPQGGPTHVDVRIPLAAREGVGSAATGNGRDAPAPSEPQDAAEGGDAPASTWQDAALGGPAAGRAQGPAAGGQAPPGPAGT